MIVENPVVILEDKIRTMAIEARGEIKTIYLHWTAGCYGHVYDDYHLCIDRDGTVYVNCKSFTELKAHTWRRNTEAIGIALCCGVDARCWLPDGAEGYELEHACEVEYCYRNNGALIDFGENPPTGTQIEVMADLVAILCEELELPITPETVMTHCEAAFEDCYGPGDGDSDMRWDLWFLPDVENFGLLVPGGNLIRGKAQFYRDLYEEGMITRLYEKDKVLVLQR